MDSRKKNRICPPSRTGIGRRLSTPRLMLMSAVIYLTAPPAFGAAAPADPRPAGALAPRREALGTADETLCKRAKALIIVRTLCRTPVIKGSHYETMSCRPAKAFIIVKTLHRTSAIKGFYYGMIDRRPVIDSRRLVIEGRRAVVEGRKLVIDDHTPVIDGRRLDEKHRRPAMEHVRPREAFDTTAGAGMHPAGRASPLRQAVPGSGHHPPHPKMQSGALRRRPCCPACPLAGAGACYMLRRY